MRSSRRFLLTVASSLAAFVSLSPAPTERTSRGDVRYGERSLEPWPNGTLFGGWSAESGQDPPSRSKCKEPECPESSCVPTVPPPHLYSNCSLNVILIPVPEPFCEVVHVITLCKLATADVDIRVKASGSTTEGFQVGGTLGLPSGSSVSLGWNESTTGSIEGEIDWPMHIPGGMCVSLWLILTGNKDIYECERNIFLSFLLGAHYDVPRFCIDVLLDETSCPK